MQDRKTIGY